MLAQPCLLGGHKSFGGGLAVWCSPSPAPLSPSPRATVQGWGQLEGVATDVEASLGVELLQLLDIPHIGKHPTFLVLQFVGAQSSSPITNNPFEGGDILWRSLLVWTRRSTRSPPSKFLLYTCGCYTFTTSVSTLPTIGASHCGPRQVDPTRL